MSIGLFLLLFIAVSVGGFGIGYFIGYMSSDYP